MESIAKQLTQERLRAEKAMQKAQVEYEEAKEEFKQWKTENGIQPDHPIYNELKQEMKDYLAAVENCRRTYDKLVEKFTIPASEQLLMTIANQQVTLADHLIPFIEELKLEQFALAASSEKSNNQAVKVDCINYYNSTNLTSLPATIACQFLGIDFPTHQVTCSHIFQRKWAKSRKIIDLQEINDVKNLLLLFKPIEVAFDEGRLCFLWDDSSSQFRMKILDPNIKGKTVLDLALRQFPNFSATNMDPILMNTIGILEGKPLITGQAIPYKRCLAFHASRARYEAIHVQKWIKAEEFTIPEDAWSPNILETPELKSQILLWLNQD